MFGIQYRIATRICLIAQDRKSIEVCYRNAQGAWSLRKVEDESIILMDHTFSLDEIYKGIELEPFPLLRGPNVIQKLKFFYLIKDRRPHLKRCSDNRSFTPRSHEDTTTAPFFSIGLFDTPCSRDICSGATSSRSCRRRGPL